MPDRIIRAKILSSETLAELSHPAERLFYRLLVLADDYGRFHASPRFIRAAAMGLLDVSVPNVGAWIAELERVDVLCLYEVAGRPYLCFKSWPRHQSLRAKGSKFPAHTGCVCDHTLAYAGKREQTDADSPGVGIGDGIGIGEEEKNARAARGHETRLIGEWFEREFQPEYPEHRRTTQEKSAKRFVTGKLRPDEQKRSEILRHLRAWKASAEWQKDAGEYVPGLMRFFDKRCHEQMPIARTTASSNGTANGHAAPRRTGTLRLVDGREVKVHPSAKIRFVPTKDAMPWYEAPDGTIYVRDGAEWL